jgi:hypothetical protein
MKLRLRGNSVRIRLTQTEVKGLDHNGAWEETVVFGPTAMHRFVYRVETTPALRPSVSMSVSGFETLVTAALPVKQVREWAGGNEVGIYFEESWGLKIVIEKDFRCLDEKRDEDESDNFDNPNTVESRHAVCHAD